MNRLSQMIARHEGFRDTMYQDTVGVPTLGYGHNLNEPITEQAAQAILEDDINKATTDLKNRFYWFNSLDPIRQDALVDMCFNLGISRLSGFHNMLTAIKNEEWDEAARQALDSKWAQQVGSRATELAEMLRTGEYVN